MTGSFRGGLSDDGECKLIHPDDLRLSLEKVFNDILTERMADVPVVNPALSVKAVGFQVWERNCLGILITPWFMNLMLVPCQGDEWLELPVGSKEFHVFPSGSYEFIVGDDPEIGRYQMCSLFSPMFEFENQDQALETADVVLVALMQEGSKSDASADSGEIEKNGAVSGTDETITLDFIEQAQVYQSSELSNEELPSQEPLTRRELLRGSFLRRQD